MSCGFHSNKSALLAAERLSTLAALTSSPPPTLTMSRCVSSSSSSLSATPKTVSIGDASFNVVPPLSPELVPQGYLPQTMLQEDLRHLRWMLQKAALGQDMFLIGPPGASRRRLALQFCEMTHREVEYVSLTRDTTEGDLKQRREMEGGSAFYMNQAAVRAALDGRILILEGIEKAERNVLPVLNNLLENREMHLEDGRFLVSPERYDALLKKHSKAELDAMCLLRVSERFLIIALGLPTPLYPGNPLDPPLRSRFQARDIGHPSYESLVATSTPSPLLVSSSIPDAVKASVTNLVGYLVALRTMNEQTGKEALDTKLPLIATNHLAALGNILGLVPPGSGSLARFVHMATPYALTLIPGQHGLIMSSLARFSLLGESNTSSRTGTSTFDFHDHTVKIMSIQELPRVVKLDLSQNGSMTANHALVTLSSPSSSQLAPIELRVAKGSLPLTTDNALHMSSQFDFVDTEHTDNILADMMLSHSQGDLCLVGPRGMGKSLLAHHFARLLGYDVVPVILHRDMSARDLIQQRVTLPNGDTSWQFSPLIMASLNGSMALLDGLHRIDPGTFTVLQRLAQDRELDLYDGTRIMRHDRYAALKASLALNDEQMLARKIRPIHPSFRMVALGEPPVLEGVEKPWLSEEIQSMFLFHTVRPLLEAEQLAIIRKLVPNLDPVQLNKLLRASAAIQRDGEHASVIGKGTSLSFRQLLRISRRLALYPKESINEAIQHALLARFMPQMSREALDQALRETPDATKENSSSNPQSPSVSSESPLKISVVPDPTTGVSTLQIGDVCAPIALSKNAHLVPDQFVFYENPSHIKVMADMLKDFTLGEHLLLVGNQGVGKNKITDRFLQLLNKPREYIQLHRDTTVQALTQLPSLQDGKIVYKDSQLVRAVAEGHVLVVDEADKAPTYVTCILKTLVESGEMILADGRSIVPHFSPKPDSPSIIRAHKDFRMIVLANRPGFPFLGNDFFGALGDVFATHAVDNPDLAGEIAMLKQYGPRVDESVLHKLAFAFNELRTMANDGRISYPYSMREIVSVVDHLNQFPQDGVSQAINNVFDFDSYDDQMKSTLKELFYKHGIPVHTQYDSINVAKEEPLPSPINVASFSYDGREPIKCDSSTKNLELTAMSSGTPRVYIESLPLNRQDARGDMFTEESFRVFLPLTSSERVRAVSQLQNGSLAVLSSGPTTLYLLSPDYLNLQRCVFGFLPGMADITMVDVSRFLPSSMFLFDAASNHAFSFDLVTREVKKFGLTSILDRASSALNQQVAGTKEPYQLIDCSLADEGTGGSPLLLSYQPTGSHLYVWDLRTMLQHKIELPVEHKWKRVFPLSDTTWGLILRQTLSGSESHFYTLKKQNANSTFPSMLQRIEHDGAPNLFATVHGMALHGVPASLVSLLDSSLTSTAKDTPSRVVFDQESFCAALLPFPARRNEKKPQDADPGFAYYSFPRKEKVFNLALSVPGLYERSTHSAVRVISKATPDSLSTGERFLEVVDLLRGSYRHIPISRVSLPETHEDLIPRVFRNSSPSEIVGMSLTQAGHLATVTPAGVLRVWEHTHHALSRSLKVWQSMAGVGPGPLRMEYDREGNLDLNGPKHGKVDEKNEPHVGGNTWAGGTGGRDTAGLGGVGGPYRLDAGHDVHQVSDATKSAVPLEVLQAAKEMGRQAFLDRLKEIDMTEYDAELYMRFSSAVKKEVTQLKSILGSLEAKGKERTWLKHQQIGDLDDNKLVEGLVGEHAIYRRRGEQDPTPGAPQEHPKLLSFVLDVSGSMYRFNGVDRRLERCMQAACMMMEALQGTGKRFQYEIIGHSGDSPEIPFVHLNSPPENDNERLKVLKKMYAHSQFCSSGDYTVEAAKMAIKKLSQKAADERFVLVLSDANFDRYGIPPETFARTLTSAPNVNAFAIFVGSLGDQARQLQARLPSGKAFVCMSAEDIPKTMKLIFTSAFNV